MANKISPITLQNNDVATLGAQGNSIIAHSNGLTSIRAAGINENEAVNPFDDDCSGIYASPGGISLNTQATQTNYQTVSTINDDNNNNIVAPTKPTPGKAILIGDSQTPAIKSFSKKLQPLTKDGVLWKSGWFLKDLKKAVEAYKKDETIQKVFINIGTNGSYSSSDNVSGLISSIKKTFPNSTLYVIEGSTGWGGVKDVQRSTIDNYYKKFTSLGVTKLQNAIGDVRKDDREQNGKIIDPNKDDQHPNTKTPGMKLIGFEIDNIIGTVTSPKLPAVDVKPLPSPTPKPISIVEQIPSDEFEDIESLPDREDSPIVIIYHQEATDIESENEEFEKALEESTIPDPSVGDNLTGDNLTGGNLVETTQINKNGITTSLVAYLLHQQGEAGAPALLYYTFVEPTSFVGKPNKFGNFNFSTNMYGIYLTDKSKYANIGSDFFNKNLFAKAKSKIKTDRHTRRVFKKNKYGKVVINGWFDTSYFTPANFLKYYIIKWEEIYKKANEKGRCPLKIEKILIKYSKKYNIPLELFKAMCYIESGFNPNTGNENYKGLFAFGKNEWAKFYPGKEWVPTVFDPELNANFGGKKANDHLAKANTLINKYVK
jgi:hypothetical protein